MEPLDKAISLVGGVTELANKLEVNVNVVSNWRKRSVPAHVCKAIEKATNGEVTCRDLRPDDWHLFWPEEGEAATGRAA